MAETAIPSSSSIVFPAWVQRLARFRDLLLPIGFIAALAVIVIPVPPFVIDLMLSANIALAAIILMTTIFVTRPLDFSVFPSLLLATTLFRLVLNIATTRLILSADAQTPDEAAEVAGKVIESFANFVTGSSIVVGLILFAILVIVQFVVITKGSTRISEVAARFTLDGMPGKQMAIDADLNAGLIDENEARRRREEIDQEADFYGAMDGASKFVRGDAIAGIIITLVNIAGGFAIGVFIKDWSMAESASLFTRLTIGDGLVSQVPAFIISIAAGLVVTRSSSRRDLGTELVEQVLGKTAALGITSGFLFALAFVGLPTIPMLSLSAATAMAAYFMHRATKEKAVAEAVKVQEEAQSATQEPAPMDQVMHIDTMELEIGYNLVRLVAKDQGGDLVERLTMIRRQLAAELGLVMPPVRIRDNMQLQPTDYNIKIRNNTVASGMVVPGQFLAMDGGLAMEPVPGMKTREPAFGLEATWIEPGVKQRAESLSYTVIDATSVLATHITEVVKTHAAELLTREETNNLIMQLKERAPKLCGEVLDNDAPLIKPGELQRVLQNLLMERVPIRDMETIVETLGDWATRTKDLDVLTEYVRNALRRTICSMYAVQEPDPESPPEQPVMVNKLYCVSLDPMLEDQINSYIERSAEGTSMAMPPIVANRITTAMSMELNRLIQVGHHPIVLASPQVRAQVRKLLEPHFPTAVVLGYNEVSKGVNVESIGLVQVNNEPEGMQSHPQGNAQANGNTNMNLSQPEGVAI